MGTQNANNCEEPNANVTSAVIAYIFVCKFGAVFRILSSFYNFDQFNSRTTLPIC